MALLKIITRKAMLSSRRPGKRWNSKLKVF